MRRRAAVAVCLTLLAPGWVVGQASPGGRRAPDLPRAPVRYTLAPAGNEARFIVREQLAGAELPNDAIGRTRSITGGIVLDAKGAVDRSASRITVDLTTLTSDEDRRDRFIKRRTIVTDSFPTAELVVTALRGLPAALPADATLSLTLLGELTIHGVTKPTSWEVQLSVRGGELSGRATTRIRFGDFGMEQPRVAVVLSVVDDIKLEFDFRFLKDDDEKP